MSLSALFLTQTHGALFPWIIQGWPDVDDATALNNALRFMGAFEQVKRATSEQAVIKLIEQHNLPWEAIPTRWLDSPSVWRTLLPRMPLMALMRNLVPLTANGVLVRYRPTRIVVNRLTDKNQLRAGQVHPTVVLSVLKTYSRGRGVSGMLTWTPVTEIVEALERAFYLSLDNVEAIGVGDSSEGSAINVAGFDTSHHDWVLN